MNRFVALMAGLATVLLSSPSRAEDDHDHSAHDHSTHDDAAAHDDHGDDSHADHEDYADYDDHAEVVPLTASELAEFEIHVATAGPDTIETYLMLPGEVRANADRLAHIVPRFAGIVTEVRAHVGDVVEKGQVLAIVESDESLAPFEVRTLIRGTVIEKHIALGEAASRDRDTFVIADLSSVWVDLAVYQRDLRRVRVGQPVRVFVGHELVPDRGTISYITPIVNETTRTATARVVLPNPEGRWRPGMFVRGHLLVEKSTAEVAVPRTALHTYENRTVVFVETAEGFVPRVVQVGQEGQDTVALDSGLTAGERYVSQGGFTIKAELGRDSLGHAGHAH
ncbi:MAG: cation efflux system protein [Gemmatimonadota bacterium]|nr:MAG: cation efflux system protein [Gemmatimonadota bacterium]